MPCLDDNEPRTRAIKFPVIKINSGAPAARRAARMKPHTYKDRQRKPIIHCQKKTLITLKWSITLPCCIACSSIVGLL